MEIWKSKWKSDIGGDGATKCEGGAIGWRAGQ